MQEVASFSGGPCPLTYKRLAPSAFVRSTVPLLKSLVTFHRIRPVRTISTLKNGSIGIVSISQQTRQFSVHEKFWPEEFLRLTVKNFHFLRPTTEMSGCVTALQRYLFSYPFNHTTRTREGMGRGSKE